MPTFKATDKMIVTKNQGYFLIEIVSKLKQDGRTVSLDLENKKTFFLNHNHFSSLFKLADYKDYKVG